MLSTIFLYLIGIAIVIILAIKLRKVLFIMLLLGALAWVVYKLGLFNALLKRIGI